MDWNICYSFLPVCAGASLSARRVWIEIIASTAAVVWLSVTLCEESVDWNSTRPSTPRIVSRHSLRGECGLKFWWCASRMLCDASLSARRVWIEIIVLYTVSVSSWSLSARRVWIEIFVRSSICISFLVTLCEESVDWNSVLLSNGIISYRHSLRGECGLKSCSCTRLACRYMSLSARRVWIEILSSFGIFTFVLVTLCEESVDWNSDRWIHTSLSSVTLCEESVDWNAPVPSRLPPLSTSLSARRVWIEMWKGICKPTECN